MFASDKAYTVHQRLDNLIAKLIPKWGNVLNQGADPTGVADSWSAIQNTIAAVAAAGGGVVYVPAGLYSISQPLVIDSSWVALRGDGGFATTILANFATPPAGLTNGIIVCGTSTSTVRSNVVVQDLAIKGNAKSIAFTATNASPCVFTSTAGTPPANGVPILLTGTMPGGFTQGTVYYVVGSSGSTFQLAATVGGAALGSTSTGSGAATTAYTGHGLVWRIEVGRIENVIVQFASGDAFHCSYGDISGSFPSRWNDSLNMKNCYAQFPGLNGLYTDQYLTSSEFFACHFGGGSLASVGSPIGGSTGPFGAWGMDVSGGNLKFFGCHPFEFPSGGALFAANGGAPAREIQIMGGEYETNLGPGIEVNAGAWLIKVVNAQFYANTLRDVWLLGNCKDVDLADCDFLSAVNASVQISGCKQSNIHHNRFDGPSIGVAAATHAIEMDAGFSNTAIGIDHNMINTAGSFNAAILMGDATNCQVDSNQLIAVSSINEAAGANHNSYIGNNVVAYGAGAIVTVGASSRAIANQGFNPIGKLSSPPAVPASGTAVTNNTGADCMVILTVSASGGATSIAIGGNATGISSSVASAVLPPVKVPAGQTITPTFTNAPTWTWWGD